MKNHRFFASDMRTALRSARRELGPDAVLVMSRQTEGGTEVIATQAPKSSATHTPTSAGGGFAALREELHGMHAKLHDQVLALAGTQYDRRHPLRAKLSAALVEAGFEPQLAHSLTRPAETGDDERVAWEETLGRVVDALSLSAEDPLSLRGTVTVVGPSGVGKTTTLAKIAAQAVRANGRDSVRLITLDQRRLGARQQVERLGELLDVEVQFAESPEALRLSAKLNDHYPLTLIDTGGLTCGDPALGELIAQLSDVTRVRPFLVMSAALQRSVFAQSVRHYGCEDIAGVILTHLDEAQDLGESLSVMIRHRLRFAALSDDATRPASLRRTHIVELVDKALRGHFQVATTPPEPMAGWKGVAAHA